MSTDPASPAPAPGAPAPRPCPLCAKPAVQQWRPFCSRGCRDRDLNAWFDEDYRLPQTPNADGEEDDR
ncbi:MAG: DNA gyrase inhibitor YacG [Sphingopyxis sp.]|nr:DNA gyrase inhibitor YacG [Sphingopyxis sp.]